MNYLPKRSIRYFKFYCTKTAAQKEHITSTEKVEYLIPINPVPSTVDLKKLPQRTRIDADTIALLERLSLVDCANKKGIETLEEAIAFADQIQQVDTKGVDPLITVLEDRPLRLEDDIVSEGNYRKQVLRNAVKTEDEYFVAPPGNIPLEPRKNLLHEEDFKEN